MRNFFKRYLLMQLVIKCRKESPFLVTVTGTTTILELKELIFKRNGILPGCQNLVAQGRVLSDNLQIQDLKLGEMSKVFLVERIRKMGKKEDSHFVEYRKVQQDSNALDRLKGRLSALLHRISDETYRELMITDRELKYELTKRMDKMLNLIESRQGGLRELIEQRQYFNELIDEIKEIAAEQCFPDIVIPSKPPAPIEDPLPPIYQKRRFFVSFIGTEQLDHAVLASMGTVNDLLFHDNEQLDEEESEEEQPVFEQIFHESGIQAEVSSDSDSDVSLD